MRKKKLFTKFEKYLILLLSVYILVIASQTLSRTRKIAAEHKIIAKQLQIAQQKHVKLKELSVALHTDSYLEKLARKKLGLVKSGEVVYKIVDEK
jgi:cell division protein FtsB